MSEFEKTMKKATAKETASQTNDAPEQGEEAKSAKQKQAEARHAKREALKALTDKAYKDISSDRNAFTDMLNTASRFLRYSPNNIMLIYAQNPEATELRTYDEWKNKEAVVKKGAKQVLVYKKKDYTDKEGEKKTFFDLEGRFDILGTVDGKVAPPPKYDEKTLVRGLVHACPATVVVDADYANNNQESAAYVYDKNEVRCKYGMSLDELVPTIINATVLATFNNSERESKVTNAEFKARCVAYILTAKYGISTDKVQIQSIPSTYESMDTDEFKAEVEEIFTTAKNIDGMVAEVLFKPKEQNKENAEKSDATKNKETKAEEER